MRNGTHVEMSGGGLRSDLSLRRALLLLETGILTLLVHQYPIVAPAATRFGHVPLNRVSQIPVTKPRLRETTRHRS